jgi:protein PhnA
MENTYPDGDNYVCADCGHEWPMNAAANADDDADAVIKDANGNVLADGDAVVLIKDLKVKGSSITLKMGTKVKSIRLVGGDHEVDCRMDAGNFMLKACYLRKV